MYTCWEKNLQGKGDREAKVFTNSLPRQAVQNCPLCGVSTSGCFGTRFIIYDCPVEEQDRAGGLRGSVEGICEKLQRIYLLQYLGIVRCIPTTLSSFYLLEVNSMLIYVQQTEISIIGIFSGRSCSNIVP